MREIPTLPADKTTRSARLSAIPVMPFPPPLGVVVPHRISRLVTESALLSRVPYSPGSRRGYIHPSPATALTCYLARREDKSDAEGTLRCSIKSTGVLSLSRPQSAGTRDAHGIIIVEPCLSRDHEDSDQ